eukprot:superscaffoldBa00013532_g26040
MSLFRNQISRGNASLQLTGVKVQDQGRYKCYTSTSSRPQESFINLRVDANCMILTEEVNQQDVWGQVCRVFGGRYLSVEFRQR